MAKHAIIIGIDDYSLQRSGGWGDLNFCKADADAIYQLCTSKFGFSQENIILLKDSRATRRNILSSITYLFNNAMPGDTVLFFYAGHGGLLPASTSSTNTKFYQSIIPYNGDYIYDFRLHQAANNGGFNPHEVNFTCILDSCHSGGMHPTVSIEQAIPRTIPFSDEVAQVLEFVKEIHPFGICLPDGSNELFPNVSNPRVENNILVDLDEDPNKTFVSSAQATLLSACKYYEVAEEHSIIGHGRFTNAILNFANGTNFDPEISYSDLMNILISDVSSATNNRQHPSIRGQQGRMSSPFLAGWNTSM